MCGADCDRLSGQVGRLGEAYFTPQAGADTACAARRTAIVRPRTTLQPSRHPWITRIQASFGHGAG
jgi:hypothetical protein